MPAPSAILAAPLVVPSLPGLPHSALPAASKLPTGSLPGLRSLDVGRRVMRSAPRSRAAPHSRYGVLADAPLAAPRAASRLPVFRRGGHRSVRDAGTRSLFREVWSHARVKGFAFRGGGSAVEAESRSALEAPFLAAAPRRGRVYIPEPSAPAGKKDPKKYSSIIAILSAYILSGRSLQKQAK